MQLLIPAICLAQQGFESPFSALWGFDHDVLDFYWSPQASRLSHLGPCHSGLFVQASGRFATVAEGFLPPTEHKVIFWQLHRVLGLQWSNKLHVLRMPLKCQCVVQRVHHSNLVGEVVKVCCIVNCIFELLS